MMHLNALTNHCTLSITTFSFSFPISFRNKINPVSLKNYSTVINSSLLFINISSAIAASFCKSENE